MITCARSCRSSLVILAAVGLLFLTGCSAKRALWQGERNTTVTANSLHPWLDRSMAWRSLSSQIKLKISLHDSTVSAKGHLLFLTGEKYELGFVKPYNRILGTFYFTPTQLLYWDVHGFPKTFGVRDTVRLADLVPMTIPDWDPRDLLPFPVSGRSGGFQTDSVWHDGRTTTISGRCDQVGYTLIFDGDGKLTGETVQRPGREPLVKQYRSIRTLKGWPLATKVVCSDAANQIQFKWYLSGIQLEAVEFQPTMQHSLPSNSEPSHDR